MSGTEYQRVWRAANRERCNAYQREYRASHPGSDRRTDRPSQRARELMRNYQLTEVEYEALLYCQDSACAICGGPEPIQGRRLAVDHSHRTGETRGILCSNCNRGIGFFHDNPVALQAAAVYLS